MPAFQRPFERPRYAHQQYTLVPDSDTATSLIPTIGEDGADPASLAGVTSYLYESITIADSYIELSPGFDARFIFPYTESVEFEGGWVLGTTFRIPTGTYTDAAGMSVNATGSHTSYYEMTVGRAAADIGTEQTTNETWYFQSSDDGYFSVVGSLPMVARVTPSERFRFGVEYVPLISFVSQSMGSTGVSVSREVFEDGVTGDSAGDYVTLQTVTDAGYETTTQTFTFSHSFETAAQFFLIPDRLRINLGAQVSHNPIGREIRRVETNGIVTYLNQSVLGTTDTTSALTDVSYSVNPDVRTDPDFEADLTLSGSIPTVDYDAGLTFFFDENMFVDLNLDSGTNIWDVSSWTLDITILQ